MVVAAPDKFRGSATAPQVAAAITAAAVPRGWTVDPAPLADGGDGFLEAVAVLGGTVEHTTVAGPLGRPVVAAWRRAGDLAAVESALASGLAVVGGAGANDPVRASSYGTGQLLVAAARAVGPGGTVVVGLGGSATTDGGAGAVAAVEEAGGLGGVTLVGACDVDVPFLGALDFAAQKGAGPDQRATLAARLAEVAAGYRDRYGVAVDDVPGAGAAGGLGGALLALGGRLRSGYGLVAELAGLEDRLARADLVVTGEGALDATSFAGKVVGGVVGDAARWGVPVVVVAGRTTPEAEARAAGLGVAAVLSLTGRCGPDRSVADPAGCIEEVLGAWLDGAAPTERPRRVAR